MAKKLGWTIFSGLLGIIFFLILIWVLNIISNNVGNQIFKQIVDFLNENLAIIILISIILLIANIFEIFMFPISMFYPLFNAVGGILWVEFIFRILILVSSFIEQDIYKIFIPFYLLAIVVVPIVVLIVGYVNIFTKKSRKEEKKSKKKREKEIEWEDVQEELKGAAYNAASKLKDSLDPEKDKKKKK